MALRTRVISICSLSHEDVWKLTSALLPRFVAADEYIVYVPEQECERFSAITGPSIQVRSQESLSAEYGAKLLHAVEASGNVRRYGWYLQQFHKIEAIARADTDATVIWDADCVPVQPITLFNDQLQPEYMRASEYNSDYFITIERLLGMRRVQDQSFVIPGFPMLKEWVRQFLDEIEQRHAPKRWFEAVIDCTDLRLPSGFSETETLGTWVANRHPGEWTSSEVRWERRGQSRFGFARDFTPEQLVSLGSRESLDIISFENWDIRGLRGLMQRGRYRLLAAWSRVYPRR